MTHAELLAAGHRVDAVAHARMARFATLLMKASGRLNLTGVRNERDLWEAHICDSLALLPLVRQAKPRNLLDLGTGGGLPGIPLACACPDLEITLLDATKKKLAAVERILLELELPCVRLLRGRAEALAYEPALRERFDAVTARAVAKLPTLLEYAAGFVRPGGVAWFFKTKAASSTEIPAGTRAAHACHLEYTQSRDYHLPAGGSGRVILEYRKGAPLPTDLPRPPGRPQKRPL